MVLLRPQRRWPPTSSSSSNTNQQNQRTKKKYKKPMIIILNLVEWTFSTMWIIYFAPTNYQGCGTRANAHTQSAHHSLFTVYQCKNVIFTDAETFCSQLDSYESYMSFAWNGIDEIPSRQPTIIHTFMSLLCASLVRLLAGLPSYVCAHRRQARVVAYAVSTESGKDKSNTSHM